MTRNFDLADPAPDVLTLLEHLERDHREGDLYRGQTREYPALIPSACRRAIIRGSDAERIVRLDSERFEEALRASRRDDVRFELLNRLIVQ